LRNVSRAFLIVAALASCLTAATYCATAAHDPIFAVPGVTLCRDKVCFQINDTSYAMPRSLIALMSSDASGREISQVSLSVPIGEFLDRTNEIALDIPLGRRVSTLKIDLVSGDYQTIQERLRYVLSQPPPYERRSDSDVANTVMYERLPPESWPWIEQVFLPVDVPRDTYYTCSKWRMDRSALPRFAEDDPTCEALAYYAPNSGKYQQKIRYAIFRSVLSFRGTWDQKVRLFLSKFIVPSTI
jgi:hypothetical protein